MSTIENLTQADVVTTLRDARIVMLTTALPDGTLLSHPMAIQEVTDDADLWFFLGLRGDQADALGSGRPVNVASAEAGAWLSVAGHAEFVDDPAKVDELWNDEAKAYFPGGRDDPDLGLLRVVGDSAQFWGLPGGKVAGIVQILKAKVTGQRTAGGSGTTEL